MRCVLISSRFLLYMLGNNYLSVGYYVFKISLGTYFYVQMTEKQQSY